MGIPANSFRSYSVPGDIDNLVKGKRPSDGVVEGPGFWSNLDFHSGNLVCTFRPMKMVVEIQGKQP